MAVKILLVNPPIYDFTAYDFWLKPYGLLSVAGYLRNQAEFSFFDYTDRQHPVMAGKKELRCDKWGRGRFYGEIIPNPTCLTDIPRYYRRFGLPRELFLDFLDKQQPCDFALIQTMMTYWYPGIAEVIEDIRRFQPNAKIILGGNYVTLCRKHAEGLKADFLLPGLDLEPLWQYLNLQPDSYQPPLWELYPNLKFGVLKLSDGCPFQCSYCAVPKVYGRFKPRPLEHSLAELEILSGHGVENIAFYDDALLFEADEVLMPFLNEVLKRDTKVNYHTPNALNARFITKPLAELMVKAGFKTFYLGFESKSRKWHMQTGSKVFSDELANAVKYLTAAGAEPTNITAYQIIGHPKDNIQQLEETMQFVNSLGIRGMLADFSPIPGTADGRLCRKWVDMDEPLMHNKTAFTIIKLGSNRADRLKSIQRQLNRTIASKQ